ncbi:TIGR01777 family oxidoreductase [Marinobacter sp.]|uniref:TIGR01777 family oxidoreductase n=1 Tax=Marinobacter sp. TaxID=50741 RepID=UPI0019BCF8FB|nr:TIGR01777 family oxidoreductase [Marinobacter sp.]MBC7193184.1 TIGR01777 family protein [Marinobacter sp.]
MGKRILITGGTGFIGQRLCQALLAGESRLTVLSRQDPVTVRSLCGRVEAANSLDTLHGHPGFDAVINLAGEGIAEKRWSQARKQQLVDSRVALTRTLAEVICSWEQKPEVLVSGSAVGFYGDQGHARVNESTTPKDEFTHRMCADWEKEALALEEHGVRVCLSRTGLVVGPDGGFLQKMLLPFRLGLGGRLGNGQQYMPWIHRDDVVDALLWMLKTPRACGPYNVVSPNPATNREFTRTLAGVLHRPALLPAPPFALKLALGEMSRLLLTGQKAVPDRLTDAGFSFLFPELGPALRDALGS